MFSFLKLENFNLLIICCKVLLVILSNVLVNGIIIKRTFSFLGLGTRSRREKWNILFLFTFFLLCHVTLFYKKRNFLKMKRQKGRIMNAYQSLHTFKIAIPDVLPLWRTKWKQNKQYTIIEVKEENYLRRFWRFFVHHSL